MGPYGSENVKCQNAASPPVFIRFLSKVIINIITVMGKYKLLSITSPGDLPQINKNMVGLTWDHMGLDISNRCPPPLQFLSDLSKIL